MRRRSAIDAFFPGPLPPMGAAADPGWLELAVSTRDSSGLSLKRRLPRAGRFGGLWFDRRPTTMPRFKDFALTYEAVNKEGTFSSGDELVGSVSFTLKEKTTVQSLSVKVKGAADVHWTEGSGDHRRSYSAKRVYCKDKQYVLMKNDSGGVTSISICLYPSICVYLSL